MTRLATPSQTVGPFFRTGLAWASGEEVAPPGPDAVELFGTVVDGTAAPVPDAVVEVWQADPRGRLAADPATGWTGFGRAFTDAAGTYRFTTLRPGRVAGADGRLQAPHIAVSVFARGLLQRLVTRAYLPGEASNDDDLVLRSIAPAARATLIAVEVAPGRLQFDIRLQGEDETVFFGW